MHPYNRSRPFATAVGSIDTNWTLSNRRKSVFCNVLVKTRIMNRSTVINKFPIKIDNNYNARVSCGKRMSLETGRRLQLTWPAVQLHSLGHANACRSIAKNKTAHNKYVRLKNARPIIRQCYLQFVLKIQTSNVYEMLYEIQLIICYTGCWYYM